MVKIKLKTNRVGQIYLPKYIRDEWGSEFEFIPNLTSGILYPSGTSAKDVLRSLRVVMADLEHLAELEQEQQGDSEQ